MERMKVRELFREAPVGRRVVVMGWVRTRRDAKGFSFIEVNDGSTLKGIQVIADGALANYASEVVHLATGASVRVEGEVVPSPAAGQPIELKAASIETIGGADESYPLQKKRHSFEYLREIAHLRPRSNTFGAIGRLRHGLAYAVHRFFHERGFYWVHTPIITASDCEGAGEMFRVTTIDPANPPRNDAGVDYGRDFFGAPSYLTVSGQLEGEIYATALGDIYTFGPTFRAENSNTPRHLAEFWMIEPEMAFCDLAGDIRVATDFIKYLAAYALEEHPEEMRFFSQFIDKNLLPSLKEVIEKDFRILSYTEAVEILERSGETWEFPIAWGKNLQAEHEKHLTEKVFKGPVAVIDYPRSIKPFYMYCNDDGKTVRAMDILVPRIGEIIGGSQREHRLECLTGRIGECGMKPEDYWWYVELRKYGTVPHAGFGLGFERLIQFVTGMQNIRDVIPFPRTPGNARF